MEAASPFEPLNALDDFHEFLKMALEIRYAKSGRVNLSDFSRKAGFTSRSYMTELLSYKKGVSLDSLRRIREALRLPKPYSKLFELLAFKKYPSLRPAQLTETSLCERIAAVRNTFMTAGQKPVRLRNRRRFTNHPHVIETFAALGTLEAGATLEEISKRTCLSADVITSCLSILLAEGAIKQDGARYKALSSQFDFFGLKSSEGLEQLVSHVCADIQERKKGIIDDSDSLIFFTAFSVDQKSLPSLKQALRSAIYEVLDQYQIDDGDRVTKMFFSLHS